MRPYPLMGKASGVNLEEKFGVGVPKAVECHLWRPSGNSCSQVDSICNACIPVGPVSMAERGILLFGQRKISLPSAQASALERSLQSHLTVGAQHGRQQLATQGAVVE
jgi:hypothetical protein